MRNVMLLMDFGQLLLLLAWAGSWLAERRQRPAPQHLHDQPAPSPGRQRLRAVLAVVSLIVAVYAFTRAWMLS
jgi:hypothetical protein